MRSILAVIVFTLFHLTSTQAQRVCATAEYTSQLLQTDAVSRQGIATAKDKIAATLSQKNNSGVALRDTSSNEIIYIPIVVHLLYRTEVENISDAQIQSQIDVLNQDFRRLNADRIKTPAAFEGVAADTRIQFCLARVDPAGKKTTGINRQYTNKEFFTTDDAMKFTATGGAASWDSKHYLNIWVVRLVGRTMAYATPPGAAAEKDGLVMSYDVFGTTGKLRAVFNKGRTATHEIGHWLGLMHTWGDASCGNDQVDDTPQQGTYNFGCPNFPRISTCSPNQNGDMFMNFMDFSDDACMNMFTKGQAKRMRALFAQGNLRNGFLNSFACDSTAAEAGPLPLPGPGDEPDTTKPVITPAEPTTFTLAPFKTYPNPVQSILIVDCKTRITGNATTISIFNSVGVIVYSKTLVSEKTTHNIGNLAKGMYIVQISHGNTSFKSRIIKL